MGKTGIEWTEVTWNPVTGCSKVSQGCKNCYAETIANRFWKDRKFTDVICHEDRLGQPLHWKKPRMIFVNSMSDLFHEDVSFQFVEKVWDTMFNTPQHIFQILTKRPKLLLDFSEYMNDIRRRIDYPNIWLGVSVENQKTADERIPILLRTPAKVRWISAEPMLGEIRLRHLLIGDVHRQRGDEFFIHRDEFFIHRLNWVVCGGESGKNKRLFNLDWARSLRDECKEAPIPFFMKQVDKIIPIPKDLMIREYPNASER